MTSVAIVEDHTLVRQSLVRTVSSEPGFHVLGDVGRADAALALVRSKRPDVVVLDIGLPGEDGLELAPKLRDAHREVRLLFLTTHADDATIRSAMAVRADAFVPKDADLDELLLALRTVASGGTYLTPPIARRVVDFAMGRSSGPGSTLTPRELEIVRLLAHGRRPKDLAPKLYLSDKTVKNHLSSIYAKLGVSSATQAVAEAFALGIVHTASPGLA